MDEIDIKAIAIELNTRSSKYKIGRLQELRERIKNLKRRPGRNIFSNHTIQNDWAFHHGGRLELQFNIGKDGLENTWFRHGVAFSFDTSRTLTTIKPLVPKVLLFNEYMNANSDEFADMRMWHFYHDTRSDDYMPGPIPHERVKENVFVFLGKCYPINQLDYDEILADFDRLLLLYRYVESNGLLQSVFDTEKSPFSFTPGNTIKSDQANVTLPPIQIDVFLRHNLMQKALYDDLVSKYGKNNVGTENVMGIGTRIDVVLQHPDSFWFYEIKTARSPRICIREAIGQLLEYSFWSKSTKISKLIVVGETSLNSDDENYLAFLKKNINIPIDYQHIADFEDGKQ